MSIHTKLLEALLVLHQSNSSGVLRIGRGLEKKQLVLEKGLLAFAESNVPKEHLARIMVATGLLPGSKMNEIASLMKTGMTSEEAVFAVSKSDSQTLEKGRREQAVVILASLLGLENGDIKFYSGEDLIRHRLSLNLALPEILVLSARRAVSDRLISLPAGFLHSIVSKEEFHPKDRMDFPMDGIESYVYSLVCGKQRAAEVLPLIPAGETSPEEILLRLYVLGLIKFDGSSNAKSGAEAAAETEPISPVQQQLEEMIMRFESANLYEILSIQPDANDEEIKAAYYELAKQYHPDRFQSEEYSSIIRNSAEQVFAYINEAFTTLGNSVSRASYDEKRLTQESKVEATLRARAAAGAEEEKMAAVLFRQGRISLSKGNFEKAVEQLKECVWLRPEKAKYRHYLGLAQLEMPQLRKKAEEHLLKAIQLDSMSMDSYLALAKLYIKVRLPRKAEMQLQKLISLDPDNVEASQLLAELKNLEATQSGVFRRTKNLFSRK